MTTIARCPACPREVTVLRRRIIAHNMPGSEWLCEGSGKAPAPADSEWVTVAEVAARLRVSKMTVYRLVADDEMLAHRFGRSLRIHRNDLDRYIRGAGLSQ